MYQLQYLHVSTHRKKDREKLERWLSIRRRIHQTKKNSSKLLQGSIPKSTAYKTKWTIILFQEWQINREVRIPVLDADGAFKDNGDLYNVHSLSTDLALYAKTLN